MTYVQSATIEAVRYDEQAHCLEARLRQSDKVIVYEDVPQQVYDLMLFADSMGDFLREQIEGKYPSYERE